MKKRLTHVQYCTVSLLKLLLFYIFFLLYFNEEGNRIVEDEEEKHKILYAPHRGSTCN